jgi:localization factor PodJL
VTRDIDQGQDLVPAGRQAGQRQRHAQSGGALCHGRDGTTDNDSAARWFNKAADLGVKDSQFNLGILQRQGRRHAAEPRRVLQVVRARRQGGDRDAAAKRDEIANRCDPNSWNAPRLRRTLEAKTPTPKRQRRRNSGELAGKPCKTASVDMKKASATSR